LFGDVVNKLPALGTASVADAQVSFTPPLTTEEVAAAFGGRFSTVEPLAAGGQGAVFRATSPGETGGVALKVYFEDQVEERTRREVNALRAMRGPTIVRLVDEGHCHIRGAKCIYIATTFIEGETLATALARGPLLPGEVARIGHDIALAIDEMWQQRVVHRDIKPANIMLTTAGGAVLIDLGLARHLALTSLTSKGKTWGTEGYFSPEQARGLGLTCRSDIFALGVSLQESLLGRHPTSRRQRDLLSGGPLTASLRPKIPPELVTVIDEMVARSPINRPMPKAVAERLRRLAGL
jgi:eukaryotic-like serine/threonine-protein kinase